MGVRVRSDAAAACVVADELLHIGANGLARVAAPTGGVAQRDVLPGHDEAHHVEHPARNLGVERVQIISHNLRTGPHRKGASI